jgi:thiamine biosynthesis lipoprotein
MAHVSVALIGACVLGLFVVASPSCMHNQPVDHSVLVRRAQMHMGTLVTIRAVAKTQPAAQAAITAGFEEIHRLEQMLSTWIQSSDLSKVNLAAGREPVGVSPETMALLKRSLEVANLTGGAFNIAIGPAVDAWGFNQEPRVPGEIELASLRERVDLSQVTLDEQSRTVFLKRSGMRLDVGGIGKGFTADRVVVTMQGAGAIGGVVALSGDIKTFGQMPDGRPFLIGIKHPRQEDGLVAQVELRDEAISTAGDYEQVFEQDGVLYHHILDPLTLHPARGCQSVSVIAKEGVIADGLDTGIFVMGPERGMELIERLPDVEAVVVDRDGNVQVSSGLKSRIRIIGGPT